MMSITVLFAVTAMIIPVTCTAIAIMEAKEKEERRKEEEEA